MRWRALVEYDGSDFAGWQHQVNRRSVQGVLTEAIAAVTGEITAAVGAGRTDAGVHAVGQVAHFDTGWGRSSEELRRAINASLPSDVAVSALEPAAPAFHARHSAVGRVYRYDLWVWPTRSPLNRRTAVHVPGPIDVALMVEAARRLVGTHDFAAFGQPLSAGGSTVRRLDRCEVEQVDGRVVVVAEGNAFLRHQVRRMVGLMVEIGLGRIAPEAVIRNLLREADAPRARTVPAQGLILSGVHYPIEVGGDMRPAAWSSLIGVDREGV